ncbi:TIGR03621 family F420-dependent LLM class oxidoreductase [Pseudosporangium ferrugineum]|uniref:Putative F420-dependent oxidoreductase n=1 Tax=Pseudosporangium ferrugineum TaxID=439699 RepID=A0A2T0SB77_9ACTN|nr:TIGR03621 family F420-dependent LLM class oxidoreductase [Pseudosporangium ferrugineum]PRY30677.1 putative F420-dependent oxidoreductase [Pseudosporangium ferrugineum]
MSRAFRFGAVLTGGDDRARWQEQCRRVEGLGYDTIAVSDHFRGNAPLPALMAAAEVTERVRLGTYVLNTALHPPALLAREVLTVHRMTGGRVEAGLGAGYDDADFQRAGVPRPTFAARVAGLAETAAGLGRLPGRPAVLVGGGGSRVLSVAAEHGDIVAFSGAAPHPPGAPARQPLLAPAQLAERVRLVAGAGERAAGLERNLMVHKVLITSDRRTAAEALHRRFPFLSIDDLLDLPTVLVGTAGQIADSLIGYRERYGFSYFSVPEPFVSVFAPVVELLEGR